MNTGDIKESETKGSLPSLKSWYPDYKTAERIVDSFSNESTGILSIKESERVAMRSILAREEYIYEHGPSRLASIESEVFNISCANLLLDFDSSLRM